MFLYPKFQKKKGVFKFMYNLSKVLSVSWVTTYTIKRFCLVNDELGGINIV
jgi:hypothetical protein